MPCQEINFWTLSGLVGAFLDLAIAYLLLCASTLAYLASKVLGLFGLCLPCPCNGLFVDPNKNKCLQGLLMNYPAEKISSVQCSVKGNFPFNSILANDPNYRANLKLVTELSNENENGEVSRSLSPGRGTQDAVGEEQCLRNDRRVEPGSLSSQGMEEGRYEVKRKGFASQGPRCGLRHRQKGSSDGVKFDLIPRYDSLQLHALAVSCPPARSTRMTDSMELLEDINLQHQVSHGFEMEETFDKNETLEKTVSSVEQLKYNLPIDVGFDGNARNAIRALEQALEEEKVACAALSLELEKERSAAATAADEAMAMILRLQEEKASIQMESRQYQRMIEEKSAYDTEEMNILKEIIIRREREKHFLEKEVEACRKLFFGNEQLECDMQDRVATLLQGASSLYSSEDPVLMLQQIDESIGESKKVKNLNNFATFEVTSTDNCTLVFEKELTIPEFNEDDDSLQQHRIHKDPIPGKDNQHLPKCNDRTSCEFEEKGLVCVERNAAHIKRDVQRLEKPTKVCQRTTQTLHVCDQNLSLFQEEEGQADSSSSCQELASQITQHINETMTSYDDDDMAKHRRDSHGSRSDIDSCVHDVHVIDNEINMGSGGSGNKTEQLPMDATLDVSEAFDTPIMGLLDHKLGRNKSSSNITSDLPLIGGPCRKSLLSNLRRNSMSAVDYERLKIDNEVGWLRERLRVVQKGREKLNVSVGHWEQDNIQLKLLEDIASQLREIRQSTAPGNAVRQASLPPSSSKVISKRRCWRSASLEMHGSA